MASDIIVFDLDGTLALNEHRVHLLPNFPAFEAQCLHDLPHVPIVNLLCTLHAAHQPGEIEIWSARSVAVEALTRTWFARHAPQLAPFPVLRMRPLHNTVPDEVLKESWLDEARARGVDVRLVFDDRDKVVQMWRRRGVVCAQVAPGAF